LGLGNITPKSYKQLLKSPWLLIPISTASPFKVVPEQLMAAMVSTTVPVERRSQLGVSSAVKNEVER
jgi:hypothetical protein